MFNLMIFCCRYLSRWIRLLFGREFPIHDLLFVWDAILAHRPTLSLVDYIFVAMLEQIRDLCKLLIYYILLIIRPLTRKTFSSLTRKRDLAGG